MLLSAVLPPIVALGNVAVADVAVVAVPCPTFHRGLRRSCHLGGGDTYYRPGIVEHRAVYLLWTPKGQHSAPGHEKNTLRQLRTAYDLVNSIH